MTLSFGLVSHLGWLALFLSFVAPTFLVAQGARGKGATLDGAAFAELSKPSSYVKPMTYGAVAPGLFDAIVDNRAPQLHLPQAAPPQRQASAVPAGG